ncbi:expression library immunization antigen 1 [Phlyctema vagabunda]|uniref:Expression library immunization antigen 1 n=1 Tax=Phlyctema vagabunda TaxID=108571 RepID=A0ABR4PGV2_9HELO
MRSQFFLSALVASTATAHFTLDYPTVRGFDEDKLVGYPCGGFDTPSTTRTSYPISGGRIALTMGHIDANVQVFLGLGNDVGSAFNYALTPVYSEQGLGDFCITTLTIPEGVNVTEGTNATIQVITNGDPDGGLYNCADITFSSSAPEPAASVCTNGTGVQSTIATTTTQPNGTTTSDTPASSSTTAAASSANANTYSAGLLVGAGALLAALL